MIAGAEVSMPVDYSQFFVAAGSSDTAPPTMFDGSDPFVQAGVTDAICISEDSRHVASVRLEVWPDEPPDLDESWEQRRTVSLVRGSGPVYLVGMDGTSLGETPMDVPAGETVSVRVACRGREQIRALRIEQREVPDGTEQWLIQFWPSGQLTS
jgi:hypothetical protein